jgi:segregation and condensation protein A
MNPNPVGHPSPGYTVTIPVYEGPLDLLLQLIERAELDITAVALALVTDQFLQHIHQMQVPADEISAFLVVAARLVQIKSEALLPRPPVREAGEEDLGEALARQLRIYKRFKELAAWLENRTDRHLHTYLRVAAPPRVEGRLDLSGITLTDLLAAAESVFEEEAEKQALGTVIAAPRITIREKIALIADLFSPARTRQALPRVRPAGRVVQRDPDRETGRVDLRRGAGDRIRVGLRLDGGKSYPDEFVEINRSARDPSLLPVDLLYTGHIIPERSSPDDIRL